MISICQNCNGQGYLEYEHGIIRKRCILCGGTGKVADDNDGDGDPSDNGGRVSAGVIGEPNTGKPKLKRKSKKSKGVRARA